jgi:hypothetical protein
VPQRLGLTMISEEVVMDNLDIFRMNGFDFKIDRTEPPTKRVRMSQIPISKGTVFGPVRACFFETPCWLVCTIQHKLHPDCYCSVAPKIETCRVCSVLFTSFGRPCREQPMLHVYESG